MSKRKQDRKSKQKAKKEKRRQEKLLEAERMLTIQRANWSAPDVAANFLTSANFQSDSPFCNYTKHNVSVHLECASPAELSAADLDTLYELTYHNMHEQYERAAETDPQQWSWSEKKKRAEMAHPEARYLIARATTITDTPSTIVGFAHIRFELEGMVEVTYVYELQLAEAAQKHGLGKRMMQLIELVSNKLDMKWVMLTVFKENVAASTFYSKLKYEMDETDPSLCDETATDEPAVYNILSKCVNKEMKAQAAAMKYLNQAVAEDIRLEEAEAAAGKTERTPTKVALSQKKMSP